MRNLLAALLLLPILGAKAQSTPTLALPLEQGHSHNDYWRPHPLRDALQLGFKSVEADIFLMGGTSLLVGHDSVSLRPEKTLQAVYLEPLRLLLRQQKTLYARPSQLWLYLDFKNAGPATYARLRGVLAEYRDILSTPEHPRADGVKVILSGGYPRPQVLADTHRLVYLDGSLADLQPTASPTSIPTVNGNWQKCFTWKGDGPMPAAEAAQLRLWSEQAQRNGQKIRFWNLPATNPNHLQALWRELLRYPALLVGADELDYLKETIERQVKS
jgi:hypothetical protein